jgi:protein-disulfide isomerase
VSVELVIPRPDEADFGSVGRYRPVHGGICLAAPHVGHRGQGFPKGEVKMKNGRPAPANRSHRARRRIEAARDRRRQRRLFLGGSVAVATVAAIGLILLSRADGGSASTLPAVVAAAPIDPAIPRDGRALGDPASPVTLVEWGDYQCPHCGRFAHEVEPQLIRAYVATGKVRFEFRDFAFLDRAIRLGADGHAVAQGDGESLRAAEAAACAVDQGRYWAYHGTLFANQAGENAGAFTRDRLVAMADAAGLDADALGRCLDGHDHRSDVLRMYEEAVRRGIGSTPTLTIDGKAIDYAGYDDLTRQLDAALAG